MTDLRWQKLTEWPLIATALAFLAAYATEILAQPTGHWHRLAGTVMTLAWVAFCGDYVVRLWIAQHRGRWFLRNLHEFAMVMLPMFRPLRLLRLVTLAGLVQRSVGGALRGRVLAFTVASTLLLIFVASLAMLDAERAQPGAAITTLPDALWWSTATITTVGYGDLSPVTGVGRLIAVGLMVAGIALLGVVTATLASWIVQKVSDQDEANQVATRNQVAELTEQISQLRAEIAAQQARPGQARSGGAPSC